MALINITLTFSFPLNVSVQVGDTAYYVPTTDVPQEHNAPLSTPQVWAGTTTPHDTQSGDIIEIGVITNIDQWNGSQSSIDCDMEDTTVPPMLTDFIFFSKDNKANLSSLLGYYALVEFRNDSTEHGELFSVGCDMFESSK